MLGSQVDPSRGRPHKSASRLLNEASGGVNRRSFLGILSGAVFLAAAPAALTACSGGAAPQAATSGSLAETVAKLVPAYKPLELVTPDIPSVNGSTPGFTSIPSSLVKSVPTPPGSGGTYTAMTPAWWAVPPIGTFLPR